MCKYNINNNAFTLVELIVVITILAILATVAFISFQGYASTSRDSVRLSDMANIEKGLNMKTSIAKKLPYPDDKIQITASGTLLNYQGYAGISVLGNIEVHGGGIDPLDQSYYTYSINDRRNKYQILGYLENQPEISFTQNTYADLNDRFPKLKGSELGILVDPVTKEPIQGSGSNVDIVNTVNEYKVILGNTLNIKGTGAILQKIKNVQEYGVYDSCKSLLKSNNNLQNNNGLYTINLKKNTLTQVECDMTTDGGGRIKVNTIIPTLDNLYEWMLTDIDTKDLTGNSRIGESGDTYPKYLITLNPTLTTNVSVDMKIDSLESLIYYRYNSHVNFSEYLDGPVENLYRKVLFKGTHSGNIKIRSETGAGKFYYVNKEYILIR